MRKIQNLIIILLLFSGVFSCTKKHDNSIRIWSSLPYTANDVKFGNTEFGDVVPYKYTDYKSINEGEEKLTANLLGGKAMSELITINGPYDHKWTITIVSETRVELKED